MRRQLSSRHRRLGLQQDLTDPSPLAPAPQPGIAWMELGEGEKQPREAEAQGLSPTSIAENGLGAPTSPRVVLLTWPPTAASSGGGGGMSDRCSPEPAERMG